MSQKGYILKDGKSIQAYTIDRSTVESLHLKLSAHAFTLAPGGGESYSMY